MKPITDSGYKLLHDGSLAFAQMEANGIRIDTDYLRRAIKHTEGQIEKLTNGLKKDKIFARWKKRYGGRTNLDSREQLAHVLFTIMGYECNSFTEIEKKPKADVEALNEINLPFVRNFLRVQKLKKAKTTYLQGILRQTDKGYLHPFFNLQFVKTFRSSCDSPNFHNQPVRDPKIKKLVRRAFIARPNHGIVEADYSGVEICGAACYHQDPRMISYIKDKTKDLHRDAAAWCYKVHKNQITSDTRYCGKNQFVFPQFYGDYYIHCAQFLWESISKMNLKTKDGLGLKEHLRKKGIKSLGRCNPEEEPKSGTFEEHIQNVEYYFWNKLFMVYGEWKKEWYYEYLKKGYFDTLSGFRIEGIYGRNDVINYPVQGTSFHWLLWSLIRIMHLLKKYRMKSLIVGQIHDSIIGDVHRKERRNYIEIVKQVMTVDIRKHWDWIIVPLTVDFEVAPVGGSWYQKKEIKV